VGNTITAASTFPLIESLPAVLREEKSWVGWQWETKDGERKKKPRHATRAGYGSSTDNTTWGTFQQVTTAMRGGAYDGVGFVLHAGNPFCGLDLDDCVDAVTGEVAAWAMAWVTQFNSYTEYSVSGTGLHIIMQATLPENKGIGTGFGAGGGLYNDKRLFFCTGNHLVGTPLTVEERQAVVDAYFAEHRPQRGAKATSSGTTGDSNLTDDEVLQFARRAKNGEKFTQLYAGEWENFDYPSQSEADAALVAFLAFYTGPCPEQLDRLFRGSGLMRDKWDEMRGAETYGEKTINYVLDRQAEFYTGKGAMGGSEYCEGSEYGTEATNWEVPTPLTTYTLPPFPTEALPAWLRTFVEAEATATQTPPDLAAMLTLSAVATAVAGKARIVVKDGYSEPLNLYTVTVLPSANRKSTVFIDVTAPLAAYEAEESARLRAEVAEAQARHRMKAAQLQNAEAVVAKAKPGDAAAREEDVFRLVRELEALPPVPSLPRLIADDATPEKVTSLLVLQRENGCARVVVGS